MRTISAGRSAHYRDRLKTGLKPRPFTDQAVTSDAQGRFEIKGLARMRLTSAQLLPRVEARDSSPSKTTLGSTGWNFLPFVLKKADQLVAGQVLNDDDKPVPV